MRRKTAIQIPGSNSHKGYMTNKDRQKINNTFNDYLMYFSEKTEAELNSIKENKVFINKEEKVTALTGSYKKALETVMYYKQYNIQENEES